MSENISWVLKEGVIIFDIKIPSVYSNIVFISDYENSFIILNINSINFGFSLFQIIISLILESFNLLSKFSSIAGVYIYSETYQISY